MFSEHQFLYWGLVFDPFRVDSCEGWKIRLSFHFSAFVKCHGAVVVLSYVGHLSNSIPYGSVCTHTELFFIALKHSWKSGNGDTSNRISYAKNYSGWLQSFALPYEFLLFLLLFLWEDSTTALTAISPEVSTAFDRMIISQVTVLSHWSHFVFWCL